MEFEEMQNGVIYLFLYRIKLLYSFFFSQTSGTDEESERNKCILWMYLTSRVRPEYADNSLRNWRGFEGATNSDALEEIDVLQGRYLMFVQSRVV